MCQSIWRTRNIYRYLAHSCAFLNNDLFTPKKHTHTHTYQPICTLYTVHIGKTLANTREPISISSLNIRFPEKPYLSLSLNSRERDNEQQHRIAYILILDRRVFTAGAENCSQLAHINNPTYIYIYIFCSGTRYDEKPAHNRDSVNHIIVARVRG